MPSAVVVGLQAHIEFVVEESCRIRAVVRPSQLVGHRSHLRKAPQNLPDLRRELGGLFERNGIRRGGAYPQRAFVQVRHELAADPGNQQQRCGEDRQNHGHRDQPVAQAPAQHSAVHAANGLVDPVARFMHVLPQKKRAQHGQQRQGAKQRAQQCERHGVRHGLEQLARWPGEHINRQVPGDDHRDRIENRPLHVARRRPDHFDEVQMRRPTRSAGILFVAGRQLAENILHHHHRSVHDDAEIDSPDGQ